MAVKHEAKKRSKNSGQMVAAIIVTVVAAVIIFGGGAYLFTRVFTGSFLTFNDSNTVQLVENEYKNTLEVQGTIRATSSETVSPQVDGTVNKINVQEGDKVKKGDVLFTMKNETLSKSVDIAQKSYDNAIEAEKKAQAAYDKALESVDSAKSDRSTAEKTARKRYKEQLAAEDTDEAGTDDGEDSGSDEEGASTSTPEFSFNSGPYDTAVEIAQDAADSALSTLGDARKSTEDALDDLNDAKDRVKHLTVKAPRDGTVVDVKIEKGATSAAINTEGFALRIVDLDTLVGAVEVPEGSVGSVSVGQDCVVTLGSGTETSELKATVYKVSDAPLKNPKTKDQGAVYAVQLTLDDTAKKAKYGMSITAAIELRDFGTVFYVPPSAVAQNGTGAYVVVVYNDNTTKEHGVTVLDTADDGQVIIQGNTLTKEMRIRSDIS